MNQKMLEPFVESVRHINQMCGVLVRKDGEVVAQHQWQEEIRQNQFSVTKSFTATAIGIAEAEGKLSIHDKVVDYFPEYMTKTTAPDWNDVTLEHLLTMSIGLKEAILIGGDKYKMAERDWATFTFSQEFSERPGEKFLYTNAGPYLLGMIVEKVYKMPMVDVLMPRLFDPLGIALPTWELDPMGRIFGSSGIMLSVTDISLFGQLYLQKGEWNGIQLFPTEWSERVSKKLIDTGKEADYKKGYSYLFWLSPFGGYRADGRYGQYSIIFPEKNAVVAINAFNTDDNDSILPYVWEKLYPEI